MATVISVSAAFLPSRCLPKSSPTSTSPSGLEVHGRCEGAFTGTARAPLHPHDVPSSLRSPWPREVPVFTCAGSTERRGSWAGRHLQRSQPDGGLARLAGVPLRLVHNEKSEARTLRAPELQAGDLATRSPGFPLLTLGKPGLPLQKGRVSCTFSPDPSASTAPGESWQEAVQRNDLPSRLDFSCPCLASTLRDRLTRGLQKPRHRPWPGAQRRAEDAGDPARRGRPAGTDSREGWGPGCRAHQSHCRKPG
ncbi:uncharacterized protein LOC124993766 [Sciurus carolinensis]|uniref:uncharacterized protein LOC124993766 n=1 Tax=Sciurus carolinensis TaxID=30640 RepID=UPI001FB208AB|nr:uncharacterized protein LOC124993766 [Sciurus carolinensis]